MQEAPYIQPLSQSPLLPVPTGRRVPWERGCLKVKNNHNRRTDLRRQTWSRELLLFAFDIACFVQKRRRKFLMFNNNAYRMILSIIFLSVCTLILGSLIVHAWDWLPSLKFQINFYLRISQLYNAVNME